MKGHGKVVTHRFKMVANDNATGSLALRITNSNIQLFSPYSPSSLLVRSISPILMKHFVTLSSSSGFSLCLQWRRNFDFGRAPFRSFLRSHVVLFPVSLKRQTRIEKLGMPSWPPSRNTIMANPTEYAGRAQRGKVQVRNTLLVFRTEADYVII
jgi:hypothetical protein